MLVNDFGLEFAMAFQILRPRLNAELDRIRSEEKAAVQKRLAAEKQALSQRIASPTKEVPPSPKTVSMQLDDELGDIVEDVKEEMANGMLIPPPRSVRPVSSPSLTAGRLVRRYGGRPLSLLRCTKREACSLKTSTIS